MEMSVLDERDTIDEIDFDSLTECEEILFAGTNGGGYASCIS